jgi:prepilin-type N-terminal cleavage/methylation domain-containing protein
VSSRRKQDAGFTLIELMIVMAIIGVLTVIAVPRFTAAVRQAKEAALKEDLHVMRVAIDSYTEGSPDAGRLGLRGLPERSSAGSVYLFQRHLGNPVR